MTVQSSPVRSIALTLLPILILLAPHAVSAQDSDADGAPHRQVRRRRARLVSQISRQRDRRRGDRRLDGEPPRTDVGARGRRARVSAAAQANVAGTRRRMDRRARRSDARADNGGGGRRGPTVNARFSALSPQVSLNFGTRDGWSYLSGGIGWARFHHRGRGGAAARRRLRHQDVQLRRRRALVCEAARRVLLRRAVPRDSTRSWQPGRGWPIRGRRCSWRAPASAFK